jgi:hypothetical protein
MSCKPTDIVNQLHLAAIDVHYTRLPPNVGVVEGVTCTYTDAIPVDVHQRQPNLSPCAASHHICVRTGTWLDPRLSRWDLVGASRVDPGTSGREPWNKSMC